MTAIPNNALIVCFILLFGIGYVFATSSQEKIEYVSNIVYDNCQNNDIFLNKNLISPADANQIIETRKDINSGKIGPNHPLYSQILAYLENIPNDISVHPIYERVNGNSKEEIIRLISSLDVLPVQENTYWNDSRGPLGIGSGLFGLKILTCGQNYLDIQSEDYYWNGVKLDPSIKETNYFTANISGNDNVTVQGENNQVSQDNNIFLQLFFSTGTIGGIIISVIIWLLKKGYTHWKNNKSNKNK